MEQKKNITKRRGRGRPMPKPVTPLGKRVLRRMKTVEIPTLRELARRISESHSIDDNQLTHILRNPRYSGSADRLIAISQVLCCSPRWLLTGKGPEECECSGQ